MERIKIVLASDGQENLKKFKDAYAVSNRMRKDVDKLMQILHSIDDRDMSTWVSTLNQKVDYTMSVISDQIYEKMQYIKDPSHCAWPQD